MSNEKKNILEQVSNERRESKLKAFKASLKGLLDELEKAQGVVSGIEDKIVGEAVSAGLTEGEVRAFFTLN